MSIIQPAVLSFNLLDIQLIAQGVQEDFPCDTLLGFDMDDCCSARQAIRTSLFAYVIEDLYVSILGAGDQ